MARAQGARAQMALAFETTYGTPPASGFTRIPLPARRWGPSSLCWAQSCWAMAAIRWRRSRTL